MATLTTKALSAFVFFLGSTHLCVHAQSPNEASSRGQVRAASPTYSQPGKFNPKKTRGLKLKEIRYDTVGPVYEISEPDILEEIFSKIRKMEDSGELARMQQEQLAIAREKIENPTPVEGLTLARVRRSWVYDPSITLNQDIVLPDGTVLGKAGQRLSPLTQASWKPWIFIDARDTTQLRAAKKWLDSQGASANQSKVIAVNGSWKKAAEALGRYVFFDQGGTYTRKFSIRATPAEVVQDGLVMRVTEFPTN